MNYISQLILNSSYHRKTNRLCSSVSIPSLTMLIRVFNAQHGALIQRSKTYEHGNTTIYMWNVRCTGNENNVWYCPRATGSKGYCSHSDDLYVACQLS